MSINLVPDDRNSSPVFGDHGAGVIESDEVDAWLAWGNSSLNLERNNCSRLHQLKESFGRGAVFGLADDTSHDEIEYLGQAKSFVVSIDWHGAFGDAIPAEHDDVKLPYPLCCFEFRISGKTALFFADQHPTVAGVGGIRGTMFVDHGDGKWIGLDEEENAVIAFARSHMRAICIALDAGIATHEIVRAPVALNAKRTKSNKPLLNDYHVVNLAKRHRTGNRLGSDTGRRHRLHFRRGHWRHFESTKTWINWMLVGDPDLSFIEKHYTL